MKKTKQKQIELVLKRINHLIRHIRNVEDNSVLLGTKLIERGEIELGVRLIANGMVHDSSKFSGIEFETLSGEPIKEEEEAKAKLKFAIHHHRKTNWHHPEAWSGGLPDMPDVYLAELVCDLKARSEEFGTSLMDYIEGDGIKRWGVTKEHPAYKKIMEFVDLLCAKPFETLNQS